MGTCHAPDADDDAVYVVTCADEPVLVSFCIDTSMVALGMLSPVTSASSPLPTESLESEMVGGMTIPEISLFVPEPKVRVDVYDADVLPCPSSEYVWKGNAPRSMPSRSTVKLPSD